MVEAINSLPISDVIPTSAKPSLPGVMGELADAMDSLKKTGQRYTEVTLLKPLRNIRNEQAKLSEEQLKILEEAEKTAKLQNVFGTSNTIASLVSTAASVIGGFMLMSSGERERGSRLMWSGGILFVNALLQHLNGWGTASRLISQQLFWGNKKAEDIGNFFLPIAVSVFMTFWGGRPLADLPQKIARNFPDKLRQILLVIQVGTQIGNQYATFKSGQVELKRIAIEGKLDITARKVEPINLRNEHQTSTWKQINDQVKGVIKKMIQGNTTAAIE